MMQGVVRSVLAAYASYHEACVHEEHMLMLLSLD